MRIACLLCFLLLSLNVFAQKGTLKGRVTAGGGPLPFTTVALSGTIKGASTNEKGDYEIKNINPGNYEVLFSCVGYQTQKIDRKSVV